MTKQIEATVTTNRARVFNLIGAAFTALPARFKAGELERLCGFKRSPMHRMLVASVLEQDFKCRCVGMNSQRVWVKP